MYPAPSELVSDLSDGTADCRTADRHNRLPSHFHTNSLAVISAAAHNFTKWIPGFLDVKPLITILIINHEIECAGITRWANKDMGISGLYSQAVTSETPAVNTRTTSAGHAS